MENKKNYFLKILNFFVFFILIIFETSGAVDISIKTAVPFILIPLLTAYSEFSTLSKSALAGFLTGASVDCVSADTFVFNTLVLMLLAVFVNLAANNLFNKNIFSALVMSLITAALYFVLMWAVFYLFSSTVEQSLTYLLGHALPSALYTSVFIVPFYYLYRYMFSL